MSGRRVAVIGTWDTKQREYEYLAAEMRRRGLGPVLIDVSCLRCPEPAQVEFSCIEVARRAGWDFSQVARQSRIEAGQVMVAGATALLRDLLDAGEIQGIIGMGGANGTAMACAIMQAFPIGFPKLVVSVMGAGDPRKNAAARDIVFINSVTDLSLNRVTRAIIANAVAALSGMLDGDSAMPAPAGAMQVGATMLGLTERCVEGIRARIETQSVELAAFHANGIGGAAFEQFIADGILDVALDLTTNELANHLLGAAFDAGPGRLEAAAARGIPQVIAPGGLDFVNFWGRSVPEAFRDRQFIFYTGTNTLMRTTPAENAMMGRVFAEKLNRNRRRVIVLVPLAGFSANDRPDGPHGVTLAGADAGRWHNPAAAAAFLQALRADADPRVVEVRAVDAHLNDPQFAEAGAAAVHDVLHRDPSL